MNHRIRTIKPSLFIAAALGLSCMAGAYVDRRFWGATPLDASGYHENVVAVAEKAPIQIGSWVGKDEPPMAGAIKILHPNMMIHRNFTHISRGWVVSFLIVHVRDARDIIGHYPPTCYPRQGQELVRQAPMDWRVQGHAIAGTEYEFSSARGGDAGKVVVDNFLIVKGKDFLRDMDEVNVAARDGTRKFFGAAQVQVVTPAGITPEARLQIFEELVGANIDVIEAIQQGKGAAAAGTTTTAAGLGEK